MKRLPPDIIEGEYEVIVPPPKVRWSFWSDDLPVVIDVVISGAVSALVIWVVHRLWS